jgi:hypothetical protein
MVAHRLTAVAIALASAAGLVACGDEYTRGAGVYSNTTTTPVPTTTIPAPGPPLQTTDSGGTESDERGQVSASKQRDVRAAMTAGRRFLAGYLPYSYGQRNASSIRSVAPALRSVLARQAPRVPPALAAKARPRLTSLKYSGIDGQRVILLAHIDDGQSRYVALLTVRRQGKQWAVSQVR